jgi:hypothetical protein
MQCALCLEEAELRRSHLIPEFLYKTLYDEKHRLHVLSILPEKGNCHEQKGLREKLLCDCCEQRFSTWERYASLLLRGEKPVTYRTEGHLIFLSELEYLPFRLFQLSILWRAGVSSLPFFSKVRLGPHAEVLRKLLLAADPGPPTRYCCVMFGIKHKKEAFTGLIMQLGKTGLCGQIAYWFVFGGFLWAFYVSCQHLPSQLMPCTLQPPGTAAFVVREATEMDNLASFAVELNRVGRAPGDSSDVKL